MSNTSKSNDLPGADLIAVLAAQNAGKGPTPLTDPTAVAQQVMLNELLELIRQDMRDKRKEKDNKEEELRRLIEARTVAFKEEIERRALAQSLCNHRKEDMKPRIGGQRLSNGHTAFICQFCYKTWIDNLPPDLQIRLEFIGG